MTRTSSNAAVRIACLGFLTIGALASIAFLLFAVGMEGMRHSYPGPSEFDSYYWIPGLPAFLSVCWLVLAFARIPKKGVMIALGFSAVLSLWWVVLAAEEGPEFAGIAATFSALSFAALLLGRRLSFFEEGPNQSPQTTRAFGPRV
jgi:hypothetical protein